MAFKKATLKIGTCSYHGHANWLTMLRGQRGVLKLQDGTKKNDKQPIHSFGYAQTKQHVNQCIVQALLVLGRTTGKLGLAKLTMAWTWGKPPPSPLQYSLHLSTRATSKWHFVLRLPSGSPKIPTTGIPATLGAHNFVCRPLIAMRSKAKLQPLLRAFQRYVTHCLHMRKSGRFLTFNGQKSPFFNIITCVLKLQMGHASPFQTSTFQQISNDIKNSWNRWVLTLAITL